MRQILASAGLVLFVVPFLACGESREPAAEPAPGGGPAAANAPASGSALTIAMQGLMAVGRGEIAEAGNEQPVIWAWMVDTRDASATNRPPCVTGPVNPHDYPEHKPLLHVTGARITDATGAEVDPLIRIADTDVVIDTGRAGFGSIDLAKLVSASELAKAGQAANALPAVKPQYAVPELAKPTPPLIARVRVLGADSVIALANTCLDPGEDRTLFTFRKTTTDCQGGEPGEELAEEVRFEQAAVEQVRVTLADGSGPPRTLVLTPTGTAMTIAVRNVMAEFETVSIDACEVEMPHHLKTYRWFYALTDFSNLPDRCAIVPCQVTGPSGGLKCPMPEPGGP